MRPVSDGSGMTLEEFADIIENKGGKPAKEEDLQAFEGKIGATLPLELRQFLMLSGGGLVFDPPAVYHDAADRFFRLRRMSDLSGISEESVNPKYYPLPRELLCIGSDAGGNGIMVCLSQDRFGEIFLLDHEMVEYEGEAMPLEEAEEVGLVTCYSASFQKFLDDVRIEDD